MEGRLLPVTYRGATACLEHVTERAQPDSPLQQRHIFHQVRSTTHRACAFASSLIMPTARAAARMKPRHVVLQSIEDFVAQAGVQFLLRRQSCELKSSSADRPSTACAMAKADLRNHRNKSSRLNDRIAAHPVSAPLPGWRNSLAGIVVVPRPDPHACGHAHQ